MRRTIASLSTSTKALIGLATVAAVALGATAAGYAVMQKTVTLSLDGETRQVTVLGSTVRDVLEAEGVRVDERDAVAPTVDSDISEGSEVAVKFARPLDVSVDGDEERYWVTATDVTGALGQLGMRFDEADLSASRGAPIGRQGLDLDVVTAKDLTVKLAEEKAKQRTVTALTVGQVLDELDVEVNNLDQVRPGVGASVEDGDRIVFTDQRKVERTKRRSVGFDTLRRADSSMYKGREVRVRAGREGVKRVTFEVTVRNGEVVKRRATDVAQVRAPVDAIFAYGTKSRPAPEPEPAPAPAPEPEPAPAPAPEPEPAPAPAPEPEPAPAPAPAPEPEPAPATNFAGGSTVWDQLADCESGGNWAINTGNGYYGGLQFNLETWRSYGGSGYPNENSRETQIMVAERVRAATGGYGSWPACSASLGLPQ